MREIKADFALRRATGAWPWIATVTVFALLAAGQGWRAWTLHGRVYALQIQREELTRQLDATSEAHRESAARLAVKPAYTADAAAIAKMAAFPLDRVLSSLESVQSLGVKVTSLEVSAAAGTVRAELEFADHAALLGYLEAINAGEPRPRWVLMQAQVSPTASAGNVGLIGSSWEVPER